MPETQRSENFSRAYVRAIAAHAGLIASRPEDDFGVDISFSKANSYQPISKKRGKRLLDDAHYVHLRCQIKSTKNWKSVGDMVRCKLEAKAYDDAVYARGKLLLLMMCLPPTFDEWLSQDEECLQLRNCCYYWKPSADDTMTPNDSTKTILTIEGQVIGLSYDGQGTREIVVEADGIGKVEMVLDEEAYQRAGQAHLREQRITVTGQLSKKGKRGPYFLTSPRAFRLVNG